LIDTRQLSYFPLNISELTSPITSFGKSIPKSKGTIIFKVGRKGENLFFCTIKVPKEDLENENFEALSEKTISLLEVKKTPKNEWKSSVLYELGKLKGEIFSIRLDICPMACVTLNKEIYLVDFQNSCLELFLSSQLPIKKIFKVDGELLLCCSGSFSFFFFFFFE